MSIQYSGGTLINFTFNSDATRRTLVDNLAQQLALAGWSYVSGSGTADVLMQSATTPQGLRIRVRILDPGSGNCAQVTMKNILGSLTSSIAYMLPTNGKQFRIVANKYQFFFFSTGAGNAQAAREILMGGTIWIPSFMVTLMGSDLDCGWLQYTGSSDTSTSTLLNFRSASYTSANSGGTSSSTLYSSQMVNYNAGGVHAGPSLSVLLAGQNSLTYKWQDNSAPVVEPLISWTSTSNSGDAPKYRGQLWDAFVVTESVEGESLLTFDGHQFIAITHQASATQRGTLCVRVS